MCQLQFAYLKEAFCPSPDEKIQTLYEVSAAVVRCVADLNLLHQDGGSHTAPETCGVSQAYAVDAKLVVSYACTPAWG